MIPPALYNLQSIWELISASCSIIGRGHPKLPIIVPSEHLKFLGERDDYAMSLPQSDILRVITFIRIITYILRVICGPGRLRRNFPRHYIKVYKVRN